MKNVAIVLAAGRGNRLRPLTDKIPKCMVLSPEGIPLLHRAAAELLKVGISDLILGVGFQKEAVSVPPLPGVRIHRVENDEWDKTNNIHTLNLCFEYLKHYNICFDNLFLIEGDVYLGESVLRRLLMEKDSATAVLPASYTKRGSCVAIDDLGYVRILADNREWNDPSIFKAANIYKLTSSDFFAVGEELRQYNRSEYYEAIIGKLIGKVRLKAVIDGECREIDNSYDRFNMIEALRSDYETIRSNWGGLWRRSVHDHFFLCNPLYPTPFIKDRLKYTLDSLIGNYPSSRRRLNQMLRAFCNVDPSFPLYAVNGASEAIRILEQHFKSRGTQFRLLFSPTFGEYLRFSLVKSGHADGLIVISPNNPTSEKISIWELRQLLASYEYIILDLSLNIEKDTAYLNLLQEHSNLIIVKSLSKLMGVPGIRIGYVAAQESCIGQLEDYLPIWNVNSIAEGFLELHLDSLSDYERSLIEWDDESIRVRQALSTMVPTDSLFGSTSFLGLRTEVNVVQPLYENFGIFVADVTHKFNDDHFHARLGIRARRHNEYLIYALKSILLGSRSPVQSALVL